MQCYITNMRHLTFMPLFQCCILIMSIQQYSGREGEGFKLSCISRLWFQPLFLMFIPHPRKITLLYNEYVSRLGGSTTANKKSHPKCEPFWAAGCTSNSPDRLRIKYCGWIKHWSYFRALEAGKSSSHLESPNCRKCHHFNQLFFAGPLKTANSQNLSCPMDSVLNML